MKKDTSIKSVLYFYSLCFLVGGLRHWLDIARDGIFPYKALPFIFNFYLTSLAIFDFIVILLLFTRPIYALIFAILIMLSDLLVDFYVGYQYWHISLLNNTGLQLLSMFGLFVFVSAPLIIRRLKYNDWLRHKKCSQKLVKAI